MGEPKLLVFARKVAAMGCQRIDKEGCGFYERQPEDFCPPCWAECLLDDDLKN